MSYTAFTLHLLLGFTKFGLHSGFSFLKTLYIFKSYCSNDFVDYYLNIFVIVVYCGVPVDRSFHIVA